MGLRGKGAGAQHRYTIERRYQRFLDLPWRIRVRAFSERPFRVCPPAAPAATSHLSLSLSACLVLSLFFFSLSLITRARARARTLAGAGPQVRGSTWHEVLSPAETAPLLHLEIRDAQR